MTTSQQDLHTSIGAARPEASKARNGLKTGLIGVAAAASMAACSVFGGKAADEPAYTVVVEEGDFQIREYGGYAVAETEAPPPFNTATRIGFRRLVRYISGANTGKRKIEMTAPVELEPKGEKISMTAPVILEPRGEKISMTAPVVLAPQENAARSGDGTALAGGEIRSWTMAFVLPEGYTAENAPAPTNPTVRVRDVAPRRVACLSFSGFLRNRRAEEERGKLVAWLQQRGLDHEGDWRVAGYNPPWTIPQLRRNEVQVSLR